MLVILLWIFGMIFVGGIMFWVVYGIGDTFLSAGIDIARNMGTNTTQTEQAYVFFNGFFSGYGLLLVAWIGVIIGVLIYANRSRAREQLGY